MSFAIDEWLKFNDTCISDFDKYRRLGLFIVSAFLVAEEFTMQFASAAMLSEYMYTVYMQLLHVAVYVYVLREQGLCPVSASEFF